MRYTQTQKTLRILSNTLGETRNHLKGGHSRRNQLIQLIQLFLFKLTNYHEKDA